MPFFANTPESRISRSDSKNPSTTCRGITSSGRPCRRPVAASNPSPVSTPTKAGNLRVDDPGDETLYCWQHKEQASLSARSSPGPRASNTPILEEERTSLDTLADRLGLIAEQQKSHASKPQQLVKQQGPGGVGGGGRNGGRQGGKQQQQHPSKIKRPKPTKTVEFCCCFRIPIEEVTPPPRPKPRPLQPPTSIAAKASSKKPSSQRLAGPASAGGPAPSSSRPSQNWSTNSSPSASPSRSQTAQYLSLIPPGASPQTASQLMAELAKPVSQVDEPGYIYMFWLTPSSQPSTPAAEAALSLLPPPAPTSPTRPAGGGQRRPSDVLASFATAGTTGGGMGNGRGLRGGDGDKKILLKIGRATNVQRRLNEWTRQCGYNLSLIRYYPYTPSASPTAVPRKMPHSHRVERLIHIELAGLGLKIADKEKCEACGREHREWFEVEATREGVANVDEVIRRWIGWDEAVALDGAG